MSLSILERPLSDFIPHRPPMLLIDRIHQYQTDNLQAEVTITEHSAFYEPTSQRVPNYVGIEYMAQTIATLAGVEADARGEPLRIGFLLGSRKLQLLQPGFDLGHSYRISVTRLYQEDTGLAVFDCQIYDSAAQLVASANVNVFQPQDTDAYIAGVAAH
ncbi:hotdog family protein [Shewanella sp. A3A]|nr:hotdog family protein [Shewanella ferrihydritica]